MNHRERELAAIRHEIPDRIPTDAINIENIPQVAKHLGISLEEVLPRLGLDGRPIPVVYRGLPPPPASGPAMTEWGTAWSEYGSTHDFPLAKLASIEAIRHYAWPDPQNYDYEEAARMASLLHKDYAVRGPYWQPLFCRVCDLVGMAETMVWMVTEPSRFEAVLDQVFERTYALCENFLRACGDDLDIFCLGDDFASQRGMLFDPSLWRRWLKPRYAKLFALAKSTGKFVWFHSCGNILAVLPDLIDIGLDVWETVQLHTLPISPQELKCRYGRHITFFGAVNTQRLPFLKPHIIKDEVRRCIEALGEGGGYICGPDHHVKPDVSPQNTLALFEAVQEFSKPGYTLGSEDRSFP